MLSNVDKNFKSKYLTIWEDVIVAMREKCWTSQCWASKIFLVPLTVPIPLIYNK